MRPLLNRRILERPYEDFDNEDFVELVADEFIGMDPWTLQVNERSFLAKIHADRIYQTWGYRTALGAHEKYEERTHTDPDLRHVQTMTDPLMRNLEQYYVEQRFTFLPSDQIALFKRQENYKKHSESHRIQISGILNEFLEHPETREAVIELSRYRFLDAVSLAFMAFVVSARQIVLLAEGRYMEAYKTGKAFIRFEEQFYEIWTPPESEDTSGNEDIQSLCTTCCTRLDIANPCRHQ